ncbi:MAG: DUF6262 family protein [Streptosporangiaceae bacterium]
MHPDNTAPIIAAARQRHELTRAKAIQALRELDRAGIPVTFQAVAATAMVSRSWLYSQADIRAEIRRLREVTCRAPSPAIPAGQRTSDSSLRARLEAALERNRTLTEENQRLRRQLEQALGERRSSPSPAGAPSLRQRAPDPGR